MDCYREMISEGTAEVRKRGGSSRPSVQSRDLYAPLCSTAKAGFGSDWLM